MIHRCVMLIMMLGVAPLCASLSKTPGVKANEPIKAVIGEVSGANYQNVAFIPGDTPTMFAASSVGKDDKTLVRASLNTATTIGLDVVSLSPQLVTLNDQAGQNNPLFNQALTNLTLFASKYPVATGTDENIFMLDTQDGLSVIKNSAPIKDANTITPANITARAQAIAANSEYIFAAVAGAGAQFSTGINRGVALLKPDLVAKVINVQGASATQIDLRPQSSIFSFPPLVLPGDLTSLGITIGNNVALHWNEPLQRLYIGLSDVALINDEDQGAMALAVARLSDDGTGLIIKPILFGLNQGQLQGGLGEQFKNTIIGFFNDTSNVSSRVPQRMSIKRITSLRTSTGKDYLIVQSEAFDLPQAGGPDSQPSAFGIFSLPLLQTSDDEDEIGTIAVQNGSASVASLAELPRAIQVPYRVGGGIIEPGDPNDVMQITNEARFFLRPGDVVSNLFVEGDVVYISLANDDDISRTGIFYSTALFDASGSIAAWTNWQRVTQVGQGPTVVAGRDANTGNYYFVSPATTLGVSIWENNQVITQSLATDFTQSAGGVYQIFDFNSGVKSFNDVDGENLAFLTLLGFDKVLLVQTLNSGMLIEPAGLIKLFDDQALKDIAPLSVAEVSRFEIENDGSFLDFTLLYRGFIFIGGYRGLVVLTDDEFNAGYFNSVGENGDLVKLSQIAELSANFTFKKVILQDGTTPIELGTIRKLASEREFLAIATDSGIYFVDQQNNTFDGTTPVTIAKKIVLPVEGAIISDMIIPNDATDPNTGEDVADLIILATTKGLFVRKGSEADNKWTEIPVGGKKGLPIIQLKYLSNRRGFDGPFGNLYVLTADRAVVPSVGSVYRYAVDILESNTEDTVKPVPLTADDEVGLLVDFKEFRGSIYADGSVILNARGKHFGDVDFLNNTPMSGDRSKIKKITPLLGVDTATNYNIGVPTINSASGALLVPGDWGIRLNQ